MRLVFVLLLATSLACGRRPEREATAGALPVEVPPVDSLSYSSVPNIPLRGTLLSDDTVLAVPTVLRVVEDLLVIGNSRADSAVVVLDRNNGSLVTTFGRSGEGPGEYRGLFALQPSIGSPFFGVAL